MIRFKVRWFRSFVALFTIVAFNATNFSFAAPAFSTATPEVSLPATLGLMHAAQIQVPAQIASLDRFYDGRGKMIFHIQNAHGQYQSEKQTEALLTHLEKHYGIKTIFAEGAWNKLNPELIRFSKDKKKNAEILDRLTHDAVIKGFETHLLNSKTSAGYGIEDATLYNEGLKAFAETFVARDRHAQEISTIETNMENRAAKLFSNDLRALIKRIEKHALDQIPLDVYLRELKALAAKHYKADLADAQYQKLYPQLVRLFKIEEMQAKFDAQSFEKEKATFLTLTKPYLNFNVIPAQAGIQSESGRGLSLATKATGTAPHALSFMAQLESLLSLKDLSVSLPAPGTAEFFMQMIQKLPPNFKYGRFPNLTAFCGLLILRSELAPENMIAEIEKLETELMAKLAATDEAKSLVAEFQNYWLTKKLINLEVTPSEFERIRGKSYKVQRTANGAHDLRSTNDDVLRSIADKALKFYSIAKQRDEVMLKGIEKRLQETGADKVAVITGGFHTEPFAQYFKNKGYSYALVTPKLTEIEDAGRDSYVHVMMTLAKHSFAPTTDHRLPTVDRRLKTTDKKSGSSSGSVLGAAATGTDPYAPSRTQNSNQMFPAVTGGGSAWAAVLAVVDQSLGLPFQVRAETRLTEVERWVTEGDPLQFSDEVLAEKEDEYARMVSDTKYFDTDNFPPVDARAEMRVEAGTKKLVTDLLARENRVMAEITNVRDVVQSGDTRQKTGALKQLNGAVELLGKALAVYDSHFGHDELGDIVNDVLGNLYAPISLETQFLLMPQGQNANVGGKLVAAEQGMARFFQEVRTLQFLLQIGEFRNLSQWARSGEERRFEAPRERSSELSHLISTTAPIERKHYLDRLLSEKQIDPKSILQVRLQISSSGSSEPIYDYRRAQGQPFDSGLLSGNFSDGDTLTITYLQDPIVISFDKKPSETDLKGAIQTAVSGLSADWVLANLKLDLGLPMPYGLPRVRIDINPVDAIYRAITTFLQTQGHVSESINRLTIQLFSRAEVRRLDLFSYPDAISLSDLILLTLARFANTGVVTQTEKDALRVVKVRFRDSDETSAENFKEALTLSQLDAYFAEKGLRDGRLFATVWLQDPSDEAQQPAVETPAPVSPDVTSGQPTGAEASDLSPSEDEPASAASTKGAKKFIVRKPGASSVVVAAKLQPVAKQPTKKAQQKSTVGKTLLITLAIGAAIAAIAWGLSQAKRGTVPVAPSVPNAPAQTQSTTDHRPSTIDRAEKRDYIKAGFALTRRALLAGLLGVTAAGCESGESDSGSKSSDRQYELKGKNLLGAWPQYGDANRKSGTTLINFGGPNKWAATQLPNADYLGGKGLQISTKGTEGARIIIAAIPIGEDPASPNRPKWTRELLAGASTILDLPKDTGAVTIHFGTTAWEKKLNDVGATVRVTEATLLSPMRKETRQVTSAQLLSSRAEKRVGASFSELKKMLTDLPSSWKWDEKNIQRSFSTEEQMGIVRVNDDGSWLIQIKPRKEEGTVSMMTISWSPDDGLYLGNTKIKGYLGRENPLVSFGYGISDETPQNLTMELTQQAYNAILVTGDILPSDQISYAHGTGPIGFAFINRAEMRETIFVNVPETVNPSQTVSAFLAQQAEASVLAELQAGGFYQIKIHTHRSKDEELDGQLDYDLGTLSYSEINATLDEAGYRNGISGIKQIELIPVHRAETREVKLWTLFPPTPGAEKFSRRSTARTFDNGVTVQFVRQMSSTASGNFDQAEIELTRGGKNESMTLTVGSRVQPFQDLDFFLTLKTMREIGSIPVLVDFSNNPVPPTPAPEAPKAPVVLPAPAAPKAVMARVVIPAPPRAEMRGKDIRVRFDPKKTLEQNIAHLRKAIQSHRRGSFTQHGNERILFYADRSVGRNNESKGNILSVSIENGKLIIYAKSDEYEIYNQELVISQKDKGGFTVKVSRWGQEAHWVGRLWNPRYTTTKTFSFDQFPIRVLALGEEDSADGFPKITFSLPGLSDKTREWLNVQESILEIVDDGLSSLTVGKLAKFEYDNPSFVTKESSRATVLSLKSKYRMVKNRKGQVIGLIVNRGLENGFFKFKKPLPAESVKLILDYTQEVNGALNLSVDSIGDVQQTVAARQLLKKLGVKTDIQFVVSDHGLGGVEYFDLANFSPDKLQNRWIALIKGRRGPDDRHVSVGIALSRGREDQKYYLNIDGAGIVANNSFWPQGISGKDDKPAERTFAKVLALILSEHGLTKGFLRLGVPFGVDVDRRSGGPAFFLDYFKSMPVARENSRKSRSETRASKRVVQGKRVWNQGLSMQFTPVQRAEARVFLPQVREKKAGEPATVITGKFLTPLLMNGRLHYNKEALHLNLDNGDWAAIGVDGQGEIYLYIGDSSQGSGSPIAIEFDDQRQFRVTLFGMDFQLQLTPDGKEIQFKVKAEQHDQVIAKWSEFSFAKTQFKVDSSWRAKAKWLFIKYWNVGVGALFLVGLSPVVGVLSLFFGSIFWHAATIATAVGNYLSDRSPLREEKLKVMSLWLVFVFPLGLPFILGSATYLYTGFTAAIAFFVFLVVMRDWNNANNFAEQSRNFRLFLAKNNVWVDAVDGEKVRVRAPDAETALKIHSLLTRYDTFHQFGFQFTQIDPFKPGSKVVTLALQPKALDALIATLLPANRAEMREPITNPSLSQLTSDQRKIVNDLARLLSQFPSEFAYRGIHKDFQRFGPIPAENSAKHWGRIGLPEKRLLKVRSFGQRADSLSQFVWTTSDRRKAVKPNDASQQGMLGYEFESLTADKPGFFNNKIVRVQGFRILMRHPQVLDRSSRAIDLIASFFVDDKAKAEIEKAIREFPSVLYYIFLDKDLIPGDERFWDDSSIGQTFEEIFFPKKASSGAVFTGYDPEPKDLAKRSETRVVVAHDDKTSAKVEREVIDGYATYFLTDAKGNQSTVTTLGANAVNLLLDDGKGNKVQRIFHAGTKDGVTTTLRDREAEQKAGDEKIVLLPGGTSFMGPWSTRAPVDQDIPLPNGKMARINSQSKYVRLINDGKDGLHGMMNKMEWKVNEYAIQFKNGKPQIAFTLDAHRFTELRDDFGLGETIFAITYQLDQNGIEGEVAVQNNNPPEFGDVYVNVGFHTFASVADSLENGGEMSDWKVYSSASQRREVAEGTKRPLDQAAVPVQGTEYDLSQGVALDKYIETLYTGLKFEDGLAIVTLKNEKTGEVLEFTQDEFFQSLTAWVPQDKFAPSSSVVSFQPTVGAGVLGMARVSPGERERKNGKFGIRQISPPSFRAVNKQEFLVLLKAGMLKNQTVKIQLVPRKPGHHPALNRLHHQYGSEVEGTIDTKLSYPDEHAELTHLFFQDRKDRVGISLGLVKRILVPASISRAEMRKKEMTAEDIKLWVQKTVLGESMPGWERAFAVKVEGSVNFPPAMTELVGTTEEKTVYVLMPDSEDPQTAYVVIVKNDLANNKADVLFSVSPKQNLVTNDLKLNRRELDAFFDASSASDFNMLEDTGRDFSGDSDAWLFKEFLTLLILPDQDKRATRIQEFAGQIRDDRREGAIWDVVVSVLLMMIPAGAAIVRMTESGFLRSEMRGLAGFFRAASLAALMVSAQLPLYAQQPAPVPAVAPAVQLSPTDLAKLKTELSIVSRLTNPGGTSTEARQQFIDSRLETIAKSKPFSVSVSQELIAIAKNLKLPEEIRQAAFESLLSIQKPDVGTVEFFRMLSKQPKGFPKAWSPAAAKYLEELVKALGPKAPPAWVADVKAFQQAQHALLLGEIKKLHAQFISPSNFTTATLVNGTLTEFEVIFESPLITEQEKAAALKAISGALAQVQKNIKTGNRVQADQENVSYQVLYRWVSILSRQPASPEILAMLKAVESKGFKAPILDAAIKKFEAALKNAAPQAPKPATPDAQRAEKRDAADENYFIPTAQTTGLFRAYALMTSVFLGGVFVAVSGVSMPIAGLALMLAAVPVLAAAPALSKSEQNLLGRFANLFVPRATVAGEVKAMLIENVQTLPAVKSLDAMLSYLAAHPDYTWMLDMDRVSAAEAQKWRTDVLALNKIVKPYQIVFVASDTPGFDPKVAGLAFIKKAGFYLSANEQYVLAVPARQGALRAFNNQIGSSAEAIAARITAFEALKQARENMWQKVVSVWSLMPSWSAELTAKLQAWALSARAA